MTGSSMNGLPADRRIFAVCALLLGVALTSLEASLVNVALPTIARDLDIGAVQATWVVSSYYIVTTMALLPLAALGEVAGYRRIYLAGLALLVVGSMGCVVADDLLSLCTARAVQGCGGAGIMAVSGALVRFTYPARLLGRGISLNAMTVGIAAASGPSMASAVLALASWQWIFAINIPLGIVALLIGSRFLPAPPRLPRRFDIVAALLSAVAFGTVFLGLSDIAHGQASWLSAVKLGVGLGVGISLFRRELHQADPLLPLDLLRHPLLGRSYATNVCAFAGSTIALVALPFYMQQRLGLTAVQTGLLMSPWPIAAVATAPVAGHFIDRFSTVWLAPIGLLLMAAGLIALPTVSNGSSTGIALSMTLTGAGFGLFQTPNNRTLLGSAPLGRSGSASGMQAASRLIGQTLGTVITATIFGAMPPNTSVTLVVAALLAAGGAAISLHSRGGTLQT
jgi:DHA2 family multidrug resistance protein-like MFS transporter